MLVFLPAGVDSVRGAIWKSIIRYIGKRYEQIRILFCAYSCNYSRWRVSDITIFLMLKIV